MDTADVVKMLRDKCERAGGLRPWSRMNGVSNGHVSEVLNGHRNIETPMLAALKLERVVTYRKLKPKK